MKKIWNVIAGMLVIITFIFLILAYRESLPFQKERGKNQTLKEMIIQEEMSPLDREIDFEALQNINPDIIAWLYIPDSNIDYPVVKGKTDTEYLYRDFQGRKNKIGSLFTFADTKDDFSEPHYCIFGHNMNGDQMFGELKKYRDKEYAKSHKKVYLYFPKRTCEYEVFSIYDTLYNDRIFLHKMQKESEEYQKLIEKMISDSTVTMDITDQNVISRKPVITLATCSDYTLTPQRLVVNGVQIQERYKF